MKDTPRGLRKHIAIFGKTNAGKSSLFNGLIGQNHAIVSAEAGTTTDPVLKSMELLPFGPVTFVDTAGLDDKTFLGQQRIHKTKDVARRIDLGIYVYDGLLFSQNQKLEKPFFNGKTLIVFTKRDLLEQKTLDNIKEKFPESICISTSSSDDLELLKKQLITILEKNDEKQKDTLIGDLLPTGSTVILVVPVDSEAPKGRLILPQVQLIRDCLDHGITAYITREIELEKSLNNLSSVDLVVTDSQAFSYVEKIVPKSIPLTSFSMLLANEKGNFKQLLENTREIASLQEKDKILILEGCTHNHTHEDIGRVKIPQLLQKYTKKIFSYDFYTGYDLPENLEAYSMIIQCGSCMINKTEVLNRLKLFESKKIPVTNYGILLAYLNGILERCQEIFIKGGKNA